MTGEASSKAAQGRATFGCPDRHLHLAFLDQEEAVGGLTLIEDESKGGIGLLGQVRRERLSRGRREARERRNAAQQALLGIAQSLHG